MQPAEMGIGDLADSAGLSRRAIRFYVQQGLIPAPLGRGRGRHYDATHLDRLRRIAQLQSAGHSLDAIRRILAGQEAPPPPSAAPRRVAGPSLSAELWTRLHLIEGVELHYDAKFNPPVEKLLALREAVWNAFASPDEKEID